MCLTFAYSWNDWIQHLQQSSSRSRKHYHRSTKLLCACTKKLHKQHFEVATDGWKSNKGLLPITLNNCLTRQPNLCNIIHMFKHFFWPIFLQCFPGKVSSKNVFVVSTYFHITRVFLLFQIEFIYCTRVLVVVKNWTKIRHENIQFCSQITTNKRNWDSACLVIQRLEVDSAQVKWYVYEEEELCTLAN